MNPKKIILSLAILLLAIRLTAVSSSHTCTFVSPCMPFATFNAVANTYGCYSFTATNAGASEPNDYYSWDFGDGATVTGIQVLHCYSPVTVTTVYTVTVAYVGPALCGPLPMTTSYTLALNPPPSTLCVYNSPSVTVAAPSVTVWTGFAIPEIMTQINFGDGTSSTWMVNHTYAQCGNYLIRLKTWDMNSSADTCYSYAAVNMDCDDVLPTGLDENSNKLEGIILFPNPTSDRIHIRTSEKIKRMVVKNICGKEMSVYENLLPEDSKEINVSGLINGTYFVEISYDNGYRCALKFVKL
jgi:hypothetical protein